MNDIRENIKDILVPATTEAEKPIDPEELADKFDPSALEAEIAKRLDFKPAGLEVLFNTDDKKARVEITSDNLVDKAGIMDQVFSEVGIYNFGGSVGYDPDEGTYAWVPVHMSWEHVSGGSNGGKMFDAFYFFDTGRWEFRDLERYAPPE